MKIVALVGGARHPYSGIPCRGRDDARAVELARQLEQTAGTPLQVVHCGAPDEPSLRAFFGMGVKRISVLGPCGDELVAAQLRAFLERERPALVLMGARAGFGSGEGLLPYRLAHSMGWPLVHSVTAIARTDEGWQVSQYRPRGDRRHIAMASPAIVTVGEGGPPPRQVAFAAARAGEVEVIAPADVPPLPDARAEWGTRPARIRAVVTIASRGTAADRMRALLAPGAGGGRLVAGTPVPEMARELLGRIRELGLWPAENLDKPT